MVYAATGVKLNSKVCRLEVFSQICKISDLKSEGYSVPAERKLIPDVVKKCPLSIGSVDQSQNPAVHQSSVLD